MGSSPFRDATNPHKINDLQLHGKAGSKRRVSCPHRAKRAAIACESTQAAKTVCGWCSRAVETHEDWLEAIRYINMVHLREHKKEAFWALAA